MLFNSELESIVLGEMLSEPNAYFEICNIIDADCFAANNKIIFEAIEQLAKSNQNIDIMTVAMELAKKTPEIKPYEIAQLTSRIGSVIHTQLHAAELKEISITRYINTTCGQLFAETTSNVHDFDKSIDKIYELVSIIENKTSISQPESVCDVIDSALLESQSEQIFTNFECIDKNAKIRNGNFVVIAGRPGQGKTTFALNLSKKIALSGKKVLFFSLEQTKKELARKLFHSYSHIDIHSLLRNELSVSESETLQYELSFFKQLPIILDSGKMTLKDVISKIKTFKRKQNIDTVFIDYIGLISNTSKSKNGTREQEVAEICRELKALALDLNLPIFALSQLNRQSENRTDKRPQLNDLRESGAIEQDADIVMFTHNPTKYGITTYDDNEHSGANLPEHYSEIIIAKSRNGETGRFEMRFDGLRSKFYEKNESTSQNMPF